MSSTRLLFNPVGFFAYDPIEAAAFAIYLIAWLAATVLVCVSFFRVRSGSQPFFGVRISLAFYAMQLLLEWIYYAVYDATELPFTFEIFWLFPYMMGLVANALLVYAFVRIALQPLVVARGFRHARAWAIGLAAFYGAVAASLWVVYTSLLGMELNTSGYYSADLVNFINLHSAYPVLIWMYSATSIVWGLVFLGMAIYALAKASGSAIDARYTIVPKLIIAASLIWTLLSLFELLVTISLDNIFRPRNYDALEHWFGVEPVVIAVVGNVLTLLMYGLFFLCFRRDLRPLYLDDIPNLTKLAPGIEVQDGRPMSEYTAQESHAV